MRPLAALLLLSSLAQAQPSPAPKSPGRPGGTGSPAAQGSPADKTEALRLTDLGTQARLRGEAAAALAYFEDAYLIYPMPRLHFEIGLAQAAMGLNLAALLSFERFLKEGTDESPAALEQATSEVARLEATIGVVEARATPADAKLTLDGEVIAPERRLRVAPGVHRLSVEREGYLRVEQSLQVGAGETVKPEVLLAKAVAPAAVEKPRRTWWIWTIAGVLAVGLVTTAVVLSLPPETKGPCDSAAPGLGCVKFGGAP